MESFLVLRELAAVLQTAAKKGDEHWALCIGEDGEMESTDLCSG